MRRLIPSVVLILIAPSAHAVAQDDANAATSPGFDRIAPVTNLDDLLEKILLVADLELELRAVERARAERGEREAHPRQGKAARAAELVGWAGRSRCPEA